MADPIAPTLTPEERGRWARDKRKNATKVERNARLHAMREAGATYREIGEAFGISASAARMVYERRERQLMRESAAACDSARYALEFRAMADAGFCGVARLLESRGWRRALHDQAKRILAGMTRQDGGRERWPRQYVRCRQGSYADSEYQRVVAPDHSVWVGCDREGWRCIEPAP